MSSKTRVYALIAYKNRNQFVEVSWFAREPVQAATAAPNHPSENGASLAPKKTNPRSVPRETGERICFVVGESGRDRGQGNQTRQVAAGERRVSLWSYIRRTIRNVPFSPISNTPIWPYIYIKQVSCVSSLAGTLTLLLLPSFILFEGEMTSNCRFLMCKFLYIPLKKYVSSLSYFTLMKN